MPTAASPTSRVPLSVMVAGGMRLGSACARWDLNPRHRCPANVRHGCAPPLLNTLSAHHPLCRTLSLPNTFSAERPPLQNAPLCRTRSLPNTFSAERPLMQAFNSGKAQQIQMETFFGHAMIPNQRFAALQKACAPWGDSDVKSVACRLQLAAANDEIGDFDIYNICALRQDQNSRIQCQTPPPAMLMPTVTDLTATDLTVTDPIGYGSHRYGSRRYASHPIPTGPTPPDPTLPPLRIPPFAHPQTTPAPATRHGRALSRSGTPRLPLRPSKRQRTSRRPPTLSCTSVGWALLSTITHAAATAQPRSGCRFRRLRMRCTSSRASVGCGTRRVR